MTHTFSNSAKPADAQQTQIASIVSDKVLLNTLANFLEKVMGKYLKRGLDPELYFQNVRKNVVMHATSGSGVSLSVLPDVVGVLTSNPPTYSFVDSYDNIISAENDSFQLVPLQGCFMVGPGLPFSADSTARQGDRTACAHALRNAQLLGKLPPIVQATVKAMAISLMTPDIMGLNFNTNTWSFNYLSKEKPTTLEIATLDAFGVETVQTFDLQDLYWVLERHVRALHGFDGFLRDVVGAELYTSTDSDGGGRNFLTPLKSLVDYISQYDRPVNYRDIDIRSGFNNALRYGYANFLEMNDINIMIEQGYFSNRVLHFLFNMYSQLVLALAVPAKGTVIRQESSALGTTEFISEGDGSMTMCVRPHPGAAKAASKKPALTKRDTLKNRKANKQ